MQDCTASRVATHASCLIVWIVQVCMHTCADLIDSVPFFDEAEEGFITSLVTLLRPEVYTKDDMIVREGEIAREMYFVKSGAVQACHCCDARQDAAQPGMPACLIQYHGVHCSSWNLSMLLTCHARRVHQCPTRFCLSWGLVWSDPGTIHM